MWCKAYVMCVGMCVHVCVIVCMCEGEVHMTRCRILMYSRSRSHSLRANKRDRGNKDDVRQSRSS